MSLPDPRDTIYGLATPPGAAGVAVVRVSGPEARSVAARLVPALGRAAPPRRLRLCQVRDPRGGELLDRALVVYLPGPGSYTAEDVVELQVHGGPAVTREVLRALGAAGARAATPGEFTLRAFLNGRLDLCEAEAVAALVEARSGQARRVALRQLQGGLGEALAPLSEEAIALLAELEASLDFPEEDLGVFDRPRQGQRLAALEEAVAALHDQAPRGRRLREGARVVLAGRPNVGKSSLLNALLGRDRAIVHATPGTTRDYLEDELELGGVQLTLVDTAGQRPAGSPAEAMGVDRARAQVAQADLVLFVISLAEGVTAEDQALLRGLGSVPFAVVLNQRDRVEDAAEAAARARLTPVIAVTAAPLGQGVEALRLGILERLGLGGAPEELPLVTEARHSEALGRAREALGRARALHGADQPEELVALEVRQAAEALAALTGQGVGEAVLDAIFSRFCLGK